MIQVGINKIIFIVLGIFLLKISFIDPMLTSRNEKSFKMKSRQPASVRVRSR